jgi:eukaryotic-like serine/threonine-protein kinase
MGMWINVQTRKWMLIFSGCMLLLSILLSLHTSIVGLETAFYQQLIDLTPRSNLQASAIDQGFPWLLQMVVICFLFGTVFICLLLNRCKRLTLIFVIPVISAMLMLEVLLALLQQVWLPMVWSVLMFSLTVVVLFLWVRFPQIKNFVLPEQVCQVKVINQYIQQKDFKTALLILKNCPFSDEMFELAYDLGMQLEEQQDWVTARSLYAWLVKFDPGMQDFVERIDSMGQAKILPQVDSSDKTKTKHFGQYQLLGKKARGATATVYDAHDTHTHKHIALKILNDKLDDDTGARDVMTFLHEALTASQLDHPNIVKIHDADIIDEQAYIAMDYVEGYPMSERLRRKKLITSGESLRIMESVLDALTAAHEKNIVHGDIKPANIMYDNTGKQYILTDFGAAYSDFRDKNEERKIIGTPAYMSPEQLNGLRIDGRSDLFSLAVTIYHLLTGHQPFSGEKLAEMKNNVLNQDVDLSILTVPEPIKQILQKALSKKPYQRYADANQMLQAVRRCKKALTKKVL